MLYNILALKANTAVVTIIVACLSLALSASVVQDVNFQGEFLAKRDVQSAVAPQVSDAASKNAVKEENPKVSDGSPQKLNCSLEKNVNDTRCLKDDGYVNSIMTQMSENKGMLLRTLYVSLGVTGIVVVYFVIRSVRLRRRRSKSRKYGIITQHDHGDVEMEPLGDGNDDDDDYTVFEMNGKR